MDEPPPIGEGRGPNAARFLAAAVGHCLSASLYFCLQKAHTNISGLTTEVRASVRRNERRRWRVAALDVHVQVDGLDPEHQAGFQRCLSLFEDFCIATQSIRQGIPVTVGVSPLESDGGDAA